jgi:hypothetical protein
MKTLLKTLCTTTLLTLPSVFGASSDLETTALSSARSTAVVAECLVILNNPSSSFEENETAILSLSINGHSNEAINSLASLLGHPDKVELFKLYNTAAHCLHAAGQQESAIFLWTYVLSNSLAPFQQVLDAAMRLNAINDKSNSLIRHMLLSFMSCPFLSAADLLSIARELNSIRGFNDMAVVAYKKVINRTHATSRQLKIAAVQLTKLARGIPIGDDSATLSGQGEAIRAWNLFISHQNTTYEERLWAEDMKTNLQVILLP